MKRLTLTDIADTIDLSEPKGPYDNFVRVYKPNTNWILVPSASLQIAETIARELSRNNPDLATVYAVGFFHTIDDTAPYRMYGLFIAGEMFIWEGAGK